MFDRLSNENYAAIVSEHRLKIAPDLRRIDAAIANTAANDARWEWLTMMRVLLLSGLFDADYYLRTNPDVRESRMDPLEHFVRSGEREGRRPNPVFWTSEFRYDIALPLPSEFEISGRRDQHVLMRLKQGLQTLLGFSEAFDCYRQLLGLPDGHRLLHKQLQSLRAAAQGAHGTFFEIAPGGEPFTAAPATLIGEGDHHGMVGVTRSSFVACLIDARVRGRSAVIELDDMVLLDYEDRQRARLEDHLDFDPAVFSSADGAAWMITPPHEAGINEHDAAFTLLGPRSGGFAHWLWDYLPRYVAAVLSHAFPPVPILIDAGMLPAHREALELMLPVGVEIIEVAPFEIVHVRRLWCAAGQNLGSIPVLANRNEPLRWDGLVASPPRFAAVIREMALRADRTAGSAVSSGRLFLGRRAFSYRRLINHGPIEAVAEAHGFRVEYPEDLDFVALVRLVREARYIAGADGPALFLTLFARPGTKLCILSHPDTAGLSGLTTLLRELEIDAVVLTGPYVRIGEEFGDGSVYQIDENGFRGFLNTWLAIAAVTDTPSTGSDRRLTGAVAKDRNARRIAAFVTVKDEVEIIGQMIDHHRALGFDMFVVCDVSSTDGTFEILEGHRSRDNFQLIRIEDSDYLESHVPTVLETLKKTGIVWVVFVAADEFCIPATGVLRDCTGLANTDLLLVDRFNIPVGPSGPMMPDKLVRNRYDELLLIAEPIANFPSYLQQHPSSPWIIGADDPGTIARIERIGAVTDGFHNIVAADNTPLRWSRPADLLIAHLPFTTRARFARKVDNARRFLVARDAAGGEYRERQLAWHWRRWVAMANEGRLDQEFERSIFDDGTIAELRSKGIVRSAAEIFKERGCPDLDY